MRIFCFAKLLPDAFNSEAAPVKPIFKVSAINSSSLWASSEKFRNTNSVLLTFSVHIKLKIKILVVHTQVINDEFFSPDVSYKVLSLV